MPTIFLSFLRANSRYTFISKAQAGANHTVVLSSNAYVFSRCKFTYLGAAFTRGSPDARLRRVSGHSSPVAEPSGPVAAQTHGSDIRFRHPVWPISADIGSVSQAYYRQMFTHAFSHYSHVPIIDLSFRCEHSRYKFKILFPRCKFNFCLAPAQMPGSDSRF